MFTGIVVERGRILADPEPRQGGVRLRIGCSPELSRRLDIGGSLCTAGVCLTVVEHVGDEVAVDLAPETLRRTTLGRLHAGSEVDLEPPLRASDPLGGHWLQGHVDGVLEVLNVQMFEAHREIRFSLPHEFAAWVVEKGSVALDGVSLTVARREPGSFVVALIPHTLEVTTLGALVAGDAVNFEADILAKYVQQAVAAYRDHVG